jgi:hypothetical protein
LKNIASIIILISLCQTLIGQGDIDNQEKLIFQNERSVSVSLNSNGFGAGYRFGKRKTYLTKQLYDIEIAYIKHPKEAKVAPDIIGYSTSRRYVPGKLNVFVNLRPSMGFQKEIFSKEDRGSIAIKYYYGAGPSLGITKPIYYTYIIGDINGNALYTIDEKYSIPQHPYGIAGRASFWKGFDELGIYPGLHANFGMSFEYSPLNQLLNAIDVNATFDAFYKKVPIMTELNTQFFFTLSVAYRFGWMVEAQYKPAKITKEGKRKKEKDSTNP